MPVEQCELTIGSETDKITPVLARVEFSESIDELDQMTAWLEIPLGYPDRKALFGKVKVGAEFELKFGGRTIAGDVVRMRWKYSPKGPEVWVVEGLEPLHRIRDLQISELSEQKLDKIVETFMKKGPKSVQVKGVGATAKELVLLDDSALGTIKKIALERNFAFYVDAKGKAQFAERNTKGKKVTLTFRDLEDADITMDLVGMPTSVEARGYDYRKDDSANGKLKAETLPAKLSKISGGDTGPDLRPSAWGKLPIALEHRFSAIDLSELKDRSLGALQAAAERFLTGEIVTDLTPDAIPSAELVIDAAPWPYMGPFRVGATTHTFGPGAGSESRISFFSDSLPKTS